MAKVQSKIKEATFRLTGQTPMLMHNINSMLLKRPSNVSADEWEQSDEAFESKMYRDGDDVVLPTRVIRGLMKNAGARAFTMGIKPPRGSYSKLVASGIQFHPMKLNQKVSDAKEELQFVGLNNKKVLRRWPKFENWSGDLRMTIFDDGMLNEDVVESLLEIAGRYVGLGDYRPEFGGFKVERIQ